MVYFAAFRIELNSNKFPFLIDWASFLAVDQVPAVWGVPSKSQRPSGPSLEAVSVGSAHFSNGLFYSFILQYCLDRLLPLLQGDP
jgi:hypothetical protein